MVLERYRTGWDAGLAPLAVRLHRLGLTPNVVTLLSFPFAVLAAAAFYLADGAASWLLLLGALGVSANAILDGLDGKLARITNTQSRKGDYLDHVIDRYSDTVILVGLALSPMGDLRWGIVALVGTFLTSYMGTQAQALGLGRNYAGFLGRADRLVILIAVPTLVFLGAWLGFVLPAGLNPIVWMLVYFGIAGNLTALQRFWSGWKGLGDAPR